MNQNKSRSYDKEFNSHVIVDIVWTKLYYKFSIYCFNEQLHIEYFCFILHLGVYTLDLMLTCWKTIFKSFSRG